MGVWDEIPGLGPVMERIYNLFYAIVLPAAAIYLVYTCLSYITAGSDRDANEIRNKILRGIGGVAAITLLPSVLSLGISVGRQYGWNPEITPAPNITEEISDPDFNREDFEFLTAHGIDVSLAVEWAKNPATVESYRNLYNKYESDYNYLAGIYTMDASLLAPPEKAYFIRGIRSMTYCTNGWGNVSTFLTRHGEDTTTVYSLQQFIGCLDLYVRYSQRYGTGYDSLWPDPETATFEEMKTYISIPN